LNQIKHLRLNMPSKLTGAELAEKAEIAPGYLSELENNKDKNPTQAVMERIAKALDSTVPEVFYPPEEKSKELSS